MISNVYLYISLYVDEIRVIDPNAKTFISRSFILYVVGFKSIVSRKGIGIGRFAAETRRVFTEADFA